MDSGVRKEKAMASYKRQDLPQAKICGLTVPDEAAACAESGAAAIGLVFYPPSPRNVELDQARRIQAALPGHVPAVGVFVNPDWDFVCRAIETCRLGAVQLHGNEPVELLSRLRRKFDINMIKVLFTARSPVMLDAHRYAADAYLVEAGKGVLPGGNAETWDWAAAKTFAVQHHTILAGGLTPENLEQAVAACLPDAVDASSGLERAPGRKDLDKVKRFLAALEGTAGFYSKANRQIHPVFTKG
jgi:phosphoribosylanthranilate isomerase